MTAFFVCFLIDNICQYVSWATRRSELPVTLMRLQLLGLIRTYLHHYIDSQLNFLNNSFRNFFVLTYVKIDPEMSTDLLCFFVQGNFMAHSSNPELWHYLFSTDQLLWIQFSSLSSYNNYNRLYVTKIRIAVL